jgi:hypothetical protein
MVEESFEDIAGKRHSVDAVIEVYKESLDRTLLRENLKKTPQQRLQDLQALQLFASEVRRAGRAPRNNL